MTPGPRPGTRLRSFARSLVSLLDRPRTRQTLRRLLMLFAHCSPELKVAPVIVGHPV
ncbi:MAG: hypothetical protein ACUVX9_13870 [Anaerolineae bacterium]